MNNVIEYIKTKSLDEGRVSTTIFLFMLTPEILEQLTLGFLRQEVLTVETRIASTIKHPKDKYDKIIAKAEAAKKGFVKHRLPIQDIFHSKWGTKVHAEYNGKSVVIKMSPNGRFSIWTSL